MDIDISDILASVSRPLQPSSHPSTLDSTSILSDHQLLTRTWTAERTSPSLLPYPTPLITRTLHRIQTQITRIEDLTAGISLPDHSSSSQNTNLILSILQTDLGRTQFLLRSYLRQRLAKVTKHAVFYARQHEVLVQDGRGGNEVKDPLLSPAEVAFLERHQALLTRFYDGSFLSAFPGNLRRLDDRAGGVDMVEGPDGGGAVVVRCLAEVWGNADEVGVGEEEGPTTELRLGRGEVWVVRWRDVRPGVLAGEVELL